MKQNIWNRICNPRDLKRAWHKVANNGGAAGPDGVTIGDFRRRAGPSLERIALELKAGTYIPGHCHAVHVPNPSGETRRMIIPTVRDRIVHTAIADALDPVLEPLFESTSFAHRPGKSVTQAVERIEALLRKGFTHVVEADIVNYFDNVDQTILTGKLKKALASTPGADPLIDTIEVILHYHGIALGTADVGLVQDSPLSALLANLYLDALDEAFNKQNVRIIRFADDFVLLCKSGHSADQALEEVRSLLDKHGLRLHDGKTGITSFDDGFEFLGHLFVKGMGHKARKKTSPSTPSSKPESPPPSTNRYDPGQRVLYTLSSDRRLSVSGQSLAISNRDGLEIARIHPRHLTRMEIGPDVGFDDQLLRHAMSCHIDTTLVDRAGRTLGRLVPRKTPRARRQLSQADFCLDSELANSLARALVRARVENARTQLSRLNRRRKLRAPIEASLSMRRTLRKLDQAGTVDEIRGIEGASAAVYWPALASLIPGSQSDYTRSRPARSPADACFNFMAYLLERDIRAAIDVAGLHPGFGCLHAAGDDREALVYDLMEPFRAPLAEGPVVFLFTSRRVDASMFYQGDDMFRMTGPAVRMVVSTYEAALARQVQATGHTKKMSWRNVMKRQALDLVRTFEAGDPTIYKPQRLSR